MFSWLDAMLYLLNEDVCLRCLRLKRPGYTPLRLRYPALPSLAQLLPRDRGTTLPDKPSHLTMSMVWYYEQVTLLGFHSNS